MEDSDEKRGGYRGVVRHGMTLNPSSGVWSKDPEYKALKEEQKALREEEEKERTREDIKKHKDKSYRELSKEKRELSYEEEKRRLKKDVKARRKQEGKRYEKKINRNRKAETTDIYIILGVSAVALVGLTFIASKIF